MSFSRRWWQSRRSWASLSLPARILDRTYVTPTGCWQWCGYKMPSGYGQVRWKGKTYLLHRAAYEAFKGDPSGRLVCHTCDNRACCNPDHLFLGTHQDNADDMVRKGRANRSPRFRGEDHPNAILTKAEVAEIRRMRGEGLTAVAIAAKFESITVHAVYSILQGKTWV